MKLSVYNIIENSTSKFSIQYSKTIKSWALNSVGIVGGLLIFLFINGFGRLNIIISILMFPVFIGMIAMINGLIPFSITAEPNCITIVRKWFATFPQVIIYDKQSIKNISVVMKRVRWAYNGTIAIAESNGKIITIFTVMDFKRDVVKNQIEFISEELSKILSLPVDKERML